MTDYIVTITNENKKYDIDLRDLFYPLQVCIQRDSQRENPIGEKVITETYNKYKDIIEVGIFNSIQNN